MLNLTKDEINARIAKNIAAIFNETDKITIINLGVGIPTQVSNYVTNDKVFLQAENGMLGVGPIANGDEIDPQLINAGSQ